MTDDQKRPPLPDGVQRLKNDEEFQFACHPGVDCFTECCRLLELALTPYDVLRLRLGTGLSSGQLHERYIIEEQTEQDLFPRYYLTMIDDGRASCAFVTKDGCSVYEHRPGACRAYPLGRAAIRGCKGSLQAYHILLKENHCNGFAEPKQQTAEQYTVEQGLDTYNRFNDALASLTQHQQIRSRQFSPDEQQLKLYSLALYDLDRFRTMLSNNEPGLPPCPQATLDNDEELLLFGIEMLKEQFFG